MPGGGTLFSGQPATSEYQVMLRTSSHRKRRYKEHPVFEKQEELMRELGAS